MGVSICGVKYNFFLSRLARPFFQKYDFSEGKSTSTAVSTRSTRHSQKTGESRTKVAQRGGDSSSRPIAQRAHDALMKSRTHHASVARHSMREAAKSANPDVSTLAQGDDRVHPGRAPRRDVARQKYNYHEDQRHSDKHFRIKRSNSVEQT